MTLIFVEMVFDWPDGTEYCTRPITDLIWNSSISNTGYKTGYNNTIITEMKTWYYSILFSWSDDLKDSKVIFNNDCQKKIIIEALHFSYDHLDMIKQSLHFGLLEYIDDIDFSPKTNTWLVISTDMMVLIGIVGIFIVIKRYRRNKGLTRSDA